MSHFFRGGMKIAVRTVSSTSAEITTVRGFVSRYAINTGQYASTVLVVDSRSFTIIVYWLIVRTESPPRAGQETRRNRWYSVPYVTVLPYSLLVT
jgi:hypothetical protein